MQVCSHHGSLISHNFVPRKKERKQKWRAESYMFTSSGYLNAIVCNNCNLHSGVDMWHPIEVDRYLKFTIVTSTNAVGTQYSTMFISRVRKKEKHTTLDLYFIYYVWKPPKWNFNESCIIITMINSINHIATLV